jgi:conjugal transfer/entry exclusion protein
MNQTNVIGSKIDQLGFQMENCCCSIKTLIKDNQIADLQNQLNQANNVAVNAAQSQYLLGQMGKWSPYPAATTGA